MLKSIIITSILWLSGMCCHANSMINISLPADTTTTDIETCDSDFADNEVTFEIDDTNKFTVCVPDQSVSEEAKNARKKAAAEIAASTATYGVIVNCPGCANPNHRGCDVKFQKLASGIQIEFSHTNEDGEKCYDIIPQSITAKVRCTGCFGSLTIDIEEFINPEEPIENGSFSFDNLAINGDKSMEISLYPNPVITNCSFSFLLNEAAYSDIVVYNKSGQLIMKKELGTLEKGRQTYELSFEKLNSGIYYLGVVTNEKAEFTQVVVE